MNSQYDLFKKNNPATCAYNACRLYTLCSLLYVSAVNRHRWAITLETFILERNEAIVSVNMWMKVI